MNYELEVSNLSLPTYTPACSKQVLRPLRTEALKKVFRCLKMQIGSQYFGFFFQEERWAAHIHCKQELRAPALCKPCCLPYRTRKFLRHCSTLDPILHSSPWLRTQLGPRRVRPSHITPLDAWPEVPTWEAGSPHTRTAPRETHLEASVWSLLTIWEFLRGKLRHGCFWSGSHLCSGELYLKQRGNLGASLTRFQQNVYFLSPIVCVSHSDL